METVKLEIDGKKVEAEGGMTVLQAARRAGINIPTLCYDENLKPYGGCRMCLVEIVRGTRKRLVASCAYPVEEGLIVTTDTPKIQRLRKLIIELVWPSWTSLAEEYGVTESRFESGLGDCNLCGLCVRYCREIAKKNAVYLEGRGVDRHPALVPGAGKECEACRGCFGLCTGGWIVSASGRAYDADA